MFEPPVLTSQKPRIKGKGAKPNPQNQRKGIKGVVKKRVFPNKTKNRMQDARQKLMQRKRSTVKDAREVLAKMAKTQDARNKLNNLRKKRGGIATTNGNIKVIGSNIVQRTDRNGKISLVTNKSKPTTGINTTIQKQLGLITAPKKTPFKRPIANPRVINQAVLNELDPYNGILMRNYEPALYKWAKPGVRTTASQLIGSLDTRKRTYQSSPQK